MAGQYSAETESYTEKVAAVGGEWPARVANLRQTFPGNEAAFRSALERMVVAAHEAQARQILQQKEQQQQRQQWVQSQGSTPGGPPQQQQQPSFRPQQPQQQGDQNRSPVQQQQLGTPTMSFPGGKSYPGQQAGPAPPTAPLSNVAPGVGMMNVPGNNPANPAPGTPGYIPYARDQHKAKEVGKRPPSAGPPQSQQQGYSNGPQGPGPSAGPSTGGPQRQSTNFNQQGTPSSSNHVHDSQQKNDQSRKKPQSGTSGPPSNGSNTSSTPVNSQQAQQGGNARPGSNQVRTNSTLNPAASAKPAHPQQQQQRQQEHPQAQQQPPATPKIPLAAPVTRSKDPLPPFFPISSGQAFMTTYPSRLRLGLTNLMQPITSNGNVLSASLISASANPSNNNGKKGENGKVGKDKSKKKDGSRGRSEDVPVVVSASSSSLSRRARNRVDYTERTDIPKAPSSSDEDDDSDSSSDGEEEDAEEVAKASRANRVLKRSGVSIAALAKDTTASSTNDKKRKRENGDENGDVGGGGRSWLGQDPPGDSVIVQPAKRHILPYVNEIDLLKKAQEKSMYVPIRIELDTDTLRIRDAFTWNLSETTITPEIFARIFCLDSDVSYETYGVQIANSIRTQLDEYTGVAEISLLTPQQESNNHESDMRVIVNVDVQIGTLHLIDRIEWDLTSSLTPEEFAKSLCQDIGLGGEAIMLVSHSIHEELLRLKKDVLELGLIGKSGSESHNAGSQAIFGGIRERGPKRLESVWRDWNDAKMFGPHVEILSPESIDVLETDKERNPRRLKKHEAQVTAVVGRDRGGRRR